MGAAAAPVISCALPERDLGVLGFLVEERVLDVVARVVALRAASSVVRGIERRARPSSDAGVGTRRWRGRGCPGRISSASLAVSQLVSAVAVCALRFADVFTFGSVDSGFVGLGSVGFVGLGFVGFFGLGFVGEWIIFAEFAE
jgi:hypothetical protein